MIDDGLVQVRCWYCEDGCEECDNTGYLRTDTETAGIDKPAFTLTVGSYDPAREFASREFITKSFETLDACKSYYHSKVGWMRSLGRVTYPATVQCPTGETVELR